MYNCGCRADKRPAQARSLMLYWEADTGLDRLKRATTLLMSISISTSLLLLMLAGCASPPAAPAETASQEVGTLCITFEFQKQSGHASNQFAVWIEDANRNYVKTLYATKFTATGGYKNRPDSLSTWVSNSDLANMSDVDTITGATPKSGKLAYTWDLTDQKGNAVPDGPYRFVVEGALRWKNHVLYTGDIEIGGKPASATATAKYVYAATADQAALTAESPENAMIGAVKAEYLPPEQR